MSLNEITEITAGSDTDSTDSTDSDESSEEESDLKLKKTQKKRTKQYYETKISTLQQEYNKLKNNNHITFEEMLQQLTKIKVNKQKKRYIGKFYRSISKIIVCF